MSAQPPRNLELKWFDPPSFVTLRPTVSIQAAHQAIERERPPLIVIGTPSSRRGHDDYEIFSLGELEELLKQLDLSQEAALGEILRVSTPGLRSFVTKVQRPSSRVLNSWLGQQVGIRLLQVDASGEPLRIGELLTGFAETRADEVQTLGQGVSRGPLGSRRRSFKRAKSPAAPSASGAEGEAGPIPVEATLSAEGPSRLGVRQVATIHFRMALGDDPSALATAMMASLTPARKVTVMLSTHGGTLEVLGKGCTEVDAPTERSPLQGAFEVRGVMAGKAMIAVIFCQGGSQLGVVPLSFNVDEKSEPLGKQVGTSIPGVRDETDDGIVDLMIDERLIAGDLVYRYRLHAPMAGLWWKEFESAPILKRKNDLAPTTRDYVDNLYRQLTQRDLRTADARSQFASEVSAMGATMGRQLIPRDLHDALYGMRETIRAIRLTAFEPYVPWELLKLIDRDGHADTRHLAEYGLVRAQSGLMGAKTLPLHEWRFLRGSYTGENVPSVGEEVAYLRARLKQIGLTPIQIDPTFRALMDAVGSGQFDALHIACHGDTDEAQAEGAELLLAVMQSADGQDERVRVLATTLGEEARLLARRPLVFLNACESGRVGPQLTAWGGWPKTFLDAGAGVFVGTAWPVRDVPARRFAERFYDGLLSKESLVEASNAARVEARKSPDASWLAFKIYGHPFARQA